MSIMKFAVCSISSTASRSPPSVIRGTAAVAALPTGFARRSGVLLVPLTFDDRRGEFIQNHADSCARLRQRREDVSRQSLISRLAGNIATRPLVSSSSLRRRRPRHRGAVEHHKVVASGERTWAITLRIASPDLARLAGSAGSIEMPFAVSTARAALLPMLSQPRRLVWLLAGRVTLVESPWLA